MNKKCIFCEISKGNISSEIVFENKDFIAIRDINPKVKGHIIVIPRKHINNFMDLESNLYENFLSTVKETIEKENIENFNLVVNNGQVAEQIIEHLHLHILPRVKGDNFQIGV